MGNKPPSLPPGSRPRSAPTQRRAPRPRRPRRPHSPGQRRSAAEDAVPRLVNRASLRSNETARHGGIDGPRVLSPSSPPPRPLPQSMALPEVRTEGEAGPTKPGCSPRRPPQTLSARGAQGPRGVPVRANTRIAAAPPRGYSYNAGMDAGLRRKTARPPRSLRAALPPGPCSGASPLPSRAPVTGTHLLPGRC